MDIYEFAMQKEQLSENFYRQLASQTLSTGLKNIFSMLADEEAKHQQVVAKMREGAAGKVTDVDILGDAKKVFIKMREDVGKFNFDLSEVELYRKARTIEEEARDYYLEKAEEVENPDQKQTFRQLADEERKHYFLIDNIIDLVSRPEHWLDNAEFFHWEPY